jgi:uncharacterized metal-binding protein YceD (DUF177 family)
MTPPVNTDLGGAPLERKIRLAEIEDNVAKTITASEAERAAIAELLHIPSLKALVFDYKLRRGGGGRVYLSGRLKAQARQSCVVTLEPVATEIDIPVDLEFWPAPLIADLENKVEDPGHSGLVDWPEPITDESVDLGCVVYESFAMALDPYPRKPGAEFEWSEDGKSVEPGETGPFATLKQLLE